MSVTRIQHVREYNRLVSLYDMGPAMYMTVGTGSMGEKHRVKGWVIFQSPKMGDKHDFARWFPNRKQAESALEATNRRK